VIADTGGAFAHSLVLNAGSRAGVGKGQAVVTGEGMVGRIAAVGERSAWVLLITDLNSRIPVTIAPAGIRAILAGNNSDRPRLVHLPPGVAISPGDRVVTSGHGGAFPPGLPVGIVAAVSEAGIDVRPFMDRSRIEYVRVVDFGLQGILRRVPAVSPPNQGFDGP
jgi:rod shape-determining protein MreC